MVVNSSAPSGAVDHSGPAVSVITPCYNAERYLEQTIQSVMAQSFADWELLIVNAASTDDTLAIAERYAAQEPRIRILSRTERLGPGPARNLAIGEARGRYIAFLDADDLWMPEKLERQIGAMRAQGLVFTHTGYRLIDQHGLEFGNPITPPATVTHAELLYSCTISCLTTVYDSHVLGKQYMPDILQSEDYALWLNLLKRTPHAVGLPDALARYRIHPGSLSRGKLRKSLYQWVVLRQEEKLGVPRAVFYFLSYAIRGLLKSKNYRAFVQAKVKALYRKSSKPADAM